MELNEKYTKTRQLLQDCKEYMQSLQDNDKTLTEGAKGLDYKSSEFTNYMEKSNEIKEKQDKNELLEEVLINNLISIQQDLLQIALDYFKENYKDKRLGEKTKKKYQDEVVNLINKKYNIDVYCYLNQRLTYNNTLEYAITICFKDYYYSNVVDNEKVIYNIAKDEAYVYYYNKIDYIDTNNIEQYVNELYQNMKNTSKELETLTKELNDKIDAYNKICIGALNYKRVNHLYLKTR